MLDLFQPLLTVSRGLLLKLMKLQWWSSSWNPLQYKIYNTVSKHIISFDILHSYMHLAAQHLHCVALLINGQCLVNASDVDWVRLPNY